MLDLITIAQYDPAHFKQIFGAILKGVCDELGEIEAKACYYEGMKEEETARNAIVEYGSPIPMCYAIYFC